MTRLPKGWRGKPGERGVYVRAHSLYCVERDSAGAWRGYREEDTMPATPSYYRFTDAMKAVDRLIKEQQNDCSV